MPVFLSELVEPGGEAGVRRAVLGSGCEVSAERALLASVLEAAQSRLTAISGVRDDILFDPWAQREAAAFGLGLPLPPGMAARSWETIEGSFMGARTMGSADIAGRLAEAGYPDAAIVDLSRPGGEAIVVKAVVPGLGAFGRGRRDP